MKQRADYENEEHERAEVKTYVLDGIVYYPTYNFPDYYAMPGGGSVSGDVLRERGAVPTKRLLWATHGRRK